ncbi:unnamed protein product [Albugo candida]|uniref:Uncharacterized protein n=1 Tax=Albugo candida TaxID=65357 RepID=A0A024FTA3_9STRA|nr:unnamed protein product [Albugo candida]|eukprot:CCI10122.1 unnamed protein product [Albugo candida]
MLSKEAISCIEKSDNCKFKSVHQKAYWFENNDPSLKQPPHASTNQEKPLPDVVVATYEEGLHQKCINCIAFTDKDGFHTLLSSIITGSSPTTAKMLQIRSQCVYKTSLCTSVMLRPGHVYELLQALQLTDGNDENADYNIEVAKVVSISYKGGTRVREHNRISCASHADMDPHQQKQLQTVLVDLNSTENFEVDEPNEDRTRRRAPSELQLSTRRDPSFFEDVEASHNQSRRASERA